MATTAPQARPSGPDTPTSTNAATDCTGAATSAVVAVAREHGAPRATTRFDGIDADAKDARAFQLRVEGMAWREIGRALGVHHTTALRAARRHGTRLAEHRAADGDTTDAADMAVVRAQILAAMSSAARIARDAEVDPRSRVAAARGVGALAARFSRIFGLMAPSTSRIEVAKVEHHRWTFDATTGLLSTVRDGHGGAP